jgi:hypothetical protein
MVGARFEPHSGQGNAASGHVGGLRDGKVDTSSGDVSVAKSWLASCGQSVQAR